MQSGDFLVELGFGTESQARFAGAFCSAQIESNTVNCVEPKTTSTFVWNYDISTTLPPLVEVSTAVEGNVGAFIIVLKASLRVTKWLRPFLV